MKAETIEIIEQYLNNELTSEQRKDFELQLTSNNDLLNDFELYKSINTTMSATSNENELRQTLQQMNKKYFAENTAVVKKGRFNKWLVIAASVIFITAVSLYFILNSKLSSEQLYADYVQHSPLHIQMRGNESDASAQKAAAEYNNKQYKAALLSIETYLKMQPEDIQMKFAAAVCYLETGKYTEGEKIFSTIAGGQTAYTDAAKWYLAMTALKQNDFEKCRSNLKGIPISSSYFTKAKELLEKLPD